MSKPMTFSKKSIFYLVLAAISFGLMVVFIFDWSKNFFGYN
jgi:CHASE3 domain sensor protein